MVCCGVVSTNAKRERGREGAKPKLARTDNKYPLRCVPPFPSISTDTDLTVPLLLAPLTYLPTPSWDTIKATPPWLSKPESVDLSFRFSKTRLEVEFTVWCKLSFKSITVLLHFRNFKRLTMECVGKSPGLGYLGIKLKLRIPGIACNGKRGC